jgi:hypothetical protein
MFDQIYLSAIRAALRPGGADCVQFFYFMFGASACLTRVALVFVARTVDLL